MGAECPLSGVKQSHNRSPNTCLILESQIVKYLSMPFSYYIDSNVNCVFIRSIGKIPLFGTQEVIQKILDDQDFDPGMNMLFDTSRSKLPSEWNYKFFTDSNSGVNQDLFVGQTDFKMAWVVADGKDFAKFHQMILSTRLSLNIVERKVYRDVETAKLWLGLQGKYKINESSFSKT